MAADFSLKDDEVPTLSSAFEELLALMTTELASDRASAADVLEVHSADYGMVIEGLQPPACGPTVA